MHKPPISFISFFPVLIYFIILSCKKFKKSTFWLGSLWKIKLFKKWKKAASALFLAPTVLKVKQSRSTGRFCETHLSKHTKSNRSPHWALHCAVPLSILREGLYSVEVEMFFVAWPSVGTDRGDPGTAFAWPFCFPSWHMTSADPGARPPWEQSPSILPQSSARARQTSKPPGARWPSTPRACSWTPRQWRARPWHFTQTSTKHNWCVEHHRLKGILLYNVENVFTCLRMSRNNPRPTERFLLLSLSAWKGTGVR